LRSLRFRLDNPPSPRTRVASDVVRRSSMVVAGQPGLGRDRFGKLPGFPRLLALGAVHVQGEPDHDRPGCNVLSQPDGAGGVSWGWRRAGEASFGALPLRTFARLDLSPSPWEMQHLRPRMSEQLRVSVLPFRAAVGRLQRDEGEAQGFTWQERADPSACSRARACSARAGSPSSRAPRNEEMSLAARGVDPGLLLLHNVATQGTT
jgi:hypothetical protein